MVCLRASGGCHRELWQRNVNAIGYDSIPANKVSSFGLHICHIVSKVNLPGCSKDNASSVTVVVVVVVVVVAAAAAAAAAAVVVVIVKPRVQPPMQALRWLPVQARIDYKLSTVTTSSLTHLPPVSLTFTLCTPLSGSFILLQRHGYFVSPMLEQKLLANDVSPTVLQSNGIRSLRTSFTFTPSMPSKLRWELTSTNVTDCTLIHHQETWVRVGFEEWFI